MKRLKEFRWVFMIVLVVLAVIFCVWEYEKSRFKSESQGISVPFSDQSHTSVMALSFKEIERFVSSDQCASLAIGISPESGGMRILYIATGLDGKPRFADKFVAGNYEHPRIVESEKEVRIVGGNWNDYLRNFHFFLGLIIGSISFGLIMILAIGGLGRNCGTP